MRPFNPHRGANQVVSPAAVSASVSVNAQAKALRLVNSGANICYVRIGTGLQAATTADYPIRANSEVIMTKAEGEETVSYISSAGTTLHIQDGEGGV